MSSCDILSVLICPVCRERMTRIGNSLVCPARHTFDLAKSGYVNLLPPGKEKNAHTGDEKAMIRARADFLARGHYERISGTLARIVADRAPDEAVVADLGSGEGYHTVNLAKTMRTSKKRLLIIGADASKYGAECAAKLARREQIGAPDGVGGDFSGTTEAAFLAANIFHLPFADASLDAAVSMFAPIPWDECRRIIKKGGILAVTSSGRDHLMEMRKLIYDEVFETDFVPECGEGFTKIDESELTYPAYLSSSKEIADLFTMTPFYYKTTEAGKVRLLNREELTVTVHVRYSVFQKI